MFYKYPAIALAVAAFANAQLPAVPSCSLQCFTKALTSDGCSSITNFACHCAKPQLVSQIQPCIAKTCSSQDQATVASVVEQICQSAGVPITVPGSGSSSSAPAKSSAAPSSSAPATSSHVASFSASPSARGSSATVSSVISPATTAASSGVATRTTSAITNPTSTVTPFTGDASQVKGAFGGIVVMAAALAFAF